MKQKFFLLAISLIQGIWMQAQVGINNPSPSATLDVSGNVLTQGNLFLENPGSDTDVSTSKLLVIKDSDNAVGRYNVVGSAYGPLNYVQFKFENTSTFGLRDGYNTKISAAKYTLAVHGYYFQIHDNQSPSVSFRTTVGSNRTRLIEGYQFYAYVVGGEWWIKGFVNNSEAYQENTKKNIDIYMDILIHRNNFITKTWEGVQSIDMGKAVTKTAPLPPGF